MISELSPTEPQNWKVSKGMSLFKIARHFLIVQSAEVSVHICGLVFFYLLYVPWKVLLPKDVD